MTDYALVEIPYERRDLFFRMAPGSMGKSIGNGSFGQVYSCTIDSFHEMLMTISGTKLNDAFFNSAEPVVVKLYHHVQYLWRLRLDEKYRVIHNLSIEEQKYFILPKIIVVATPPGGGETEVLCEVQRYGGNSATQRIKRRFISRIFKSLQTIYRLTQKICLEQGILLTDIKKENIVISDIGDVAIIDFGLAHVDTVDPGQHFEFTLMADTVPPQFISFLQRRATDRRIIDYIRKIYRNKGGGELGSVHVSDDRQIASFTLYWSFVHIIGFLEKELGIEPTRYYQQVIRPMKQRRQVRQTLPLPSAQEVELQKQNPRIRKVSDDEKMDDAYQQLLDGDGSRLGDLLRHGASVITGQKIAIQITAFDLVDAFKQLANIRSTRYNERIKTKLRNVLLTYVSRLNPYINKMSTLKNIIETIHDHQMTPFRNLFQRPPTFMDRIRSTFGGGRVES